MTSQETVVAEQHGLPAGYALAGAVGIVPR
ncbi:hypothetical protein BH23CHL1_BH23CHL1_25990 [soil metagenome]